MLSTRQLLCKLYRKTRRGNHSDNELGVNELDADLESSRRGVARRGQLRRLASASFVATTSASSQPTNSTKLKRLEYLDDASEASEQVGSGGGGGGEAHGKWYSCAQCRTHLASHDELVSKLFQGNNGRAYLFNKVVNVCSGVEVQRELLTGLHSVADISCASCNKMLGWRYVRAFVASQKYKEGKFIIEQSNFLTQKSWDVSSYNVRRTLVRSWLSAESATRAARCWPLSSSTQAACGNVAELAAACNVDSLLATWWPRGQRHARERNSRRAARQDRRDRPQHSASSSSANVARSKLAARDTNSALPAASTARLPQHTAATATASSSPSTSATRSCELADASTRIEINASKGSQLQLAASSATSVAAPRVVGKLSRLLVVDLLPLQASYRLNVLLNGNYVALPAGGQLQQVQPTATPSCSSSAGGGGGARQVSTCFTIEPQASAAPRTCLPTPPLDGDQVV